MFAEEYVPPTTLKLSNSDECESKNDEDVRDRNCRRDTSTELEADAEGISIEIK